MLRWLVALTLASTLCFGQAGRAELFGTIQDPSGLTVPKAKVEAEDQATMVHYSVTSDDRGEYHVLGLPAGQYSLTVEQPGFRTYHQSGITLRLGDRTGINVKLDIGQPSQTIEVTAGAPLLQTAGGEVSLNVDEQKITTLPLDGRNFIPLVTLAPGVALAGGGSLLPRINGSRPRTNEYLYDGISVLQPEPGQVVFYPIIDGMAEFKLNINSYSPEYGRSNGGTVMLIGKSGSNQFHGDAFEFFRNEALNARNLFAQPGPNPKYRRNQYGATTGGPIQTNRTFFFVDWQETRLRTGLIRPSVVPTLAQRQGVFTQQIFDPDTNPRTPFPNNTIPITRFDPIAQQILDHYPLPNTIGANNYVRTATEPENQDQADFRVDRYFKDQHRVFGRYTYFRDDDNAATPLPDGSGSVTTAVIGHAITRGDALAGDYTWTLSPTTLNQFRAGYSRRDFNQSSLQDGGITIPGLPANSFASVLPIFTVTGLQQIGPTTAANSNFKTSITEFLDTFTSIRGRHTIKFGVDFRREALDILNPPNPTGSFGFTTTGTNSSTATGGNALASLLLGQAGTFSIDIQKQLLQERAHIAEFFVGDDWKVSPRLTLNIGTRYTLNFPSTEKHDQGAVFNLNTQVLDFVHTARKLQWGDFGPRFGAAYRIGDNWVLRAGYGMVYFEQSGITTPFTIPQFPFVQTVSQSTQDNINRVFLLSQGPTVQVIAPNPNSGLGQGVFGVDSNNGSGYSQQWSFTTQRTIGKDWNIEVSYLGSKNTRLGIPDPNINQLPSQYLSQGAALLTRVPNPYFGQIPASSSLGGATIAEQLLLRPYPRFTNVVLFRDNVGQSTYNAAAAKLEKRISHGLTVTASYTFSKLIDDASSVFSQTIFTGPVLGTTGAADANNRHLEKDLSSGDIPRVFALGWVYDVPRLWKIAGWQIAGLVRIQAGDTVPVTQATNNNSALGYVVQRPNLVSDPNDFASRTVAKYFNTAAFTAAGQFVIGNSSRDPVRGPGLQNADLMIGKTFRLSERLSLEFRAEAFNVSNTPPLNDPNGIFNPAATTFGTISTAGNPRDFEFVLKVHF